MLYNKYYWEQSFLKNQVMAKKFNRTGNGIIKLKTYEDYGTDGVLIIKGESIPLEVKQRQDNTISKYITEKVWKYPNNTIQIIQQKSSLENLDNLAFLVYDKEYKGCFLTLTRNWTPQDFAVRAFQSEDSKRVSKFISCYILDIHEGRFIRFDS